MIVQQIMDKREGVSCAVLQQTVKKQAQIIRKLESEIRERCQSYLLHANSFKKTVINSQKYIKSNNGGEENEQNVNMIGKQNKLKQLKVKQFNIQSTVCLTVKPQQNTDYVDIFTISVINSLKNTIKEQQIQRNNAIVKNQELQIVIEKLKKQNLSLKNTIQKYKKNAQANQWRIQNLRKFQQSFYLLCKQVNCVALAHKSPSEIVSEYILKRQGLQNSSLNELSNSPPKITKWNEVQAMNKSIRNEAIENCSPTVMHKETKQSMLTTTSAFGTDKKSSYMSKSQQIPQFKRMNTLQGGYYIEEDLPLADNPYIKRQFIRRKIVKRCITVSAYQTQKKEKSEIKAIIKNKINSFNKTTPLLQSNIPVVEEANRQSEVSRVSMKSNGDEIRIIDISTNGVNSTLIYHITS